MLICLVTFIATVVFLKGSDSALLEPVKQCVPTATVRGPCHVCVCSPEGVFHCRQRVCQKEIAGLSRPTRDCEPNLIFRQDNFFCTCSNEGFWLSETCEETFSYLHSNNNDPVQNLRTNVACTPSVLYLFDCNVCVCPLNGVINITQCTNRYCGGGHKADTCVYGDVLRFENEICSCSDINYFVDRLCVKVEDKVVQTLPAEDVLKLDDIGRSWRRLRDLQTEFCDSDVMYNVDCNRCACVEGRLVCTKRICDEIKKAVPLRDDKLNEIESLPELKTVNGSLCEPGKQYRLKCNICSCGLDGHASCTTMVCLEDLVLDEKALRGLLSTANVTSGQTKLPEIKHGMTCVYGKTYKMDCNTCRCGHRNSLLCTKVACLEPSKTEVNEDISNNESKLAMKNRDENGIEKKRRIRKVIRRENKRFLTTHSTGLPSLPPSGICYPGRIYQEGCKRCFCKANRMPACSAANACVQPKVPRDLVPEDLRPPVKEKEFKILPVLLHSASPCAPGTTYKVDCNVCLCDDHQNLLCDKLLCISFADIHRAEAMKKSGLPCNINNNAENEVLQSKCVQCSCNGTTFCEVKENCVGETETIMRSYGTRRNGARLTFDYEKQKCIPNHVYKDNCNKCYCQEDQTLRCTQKICLNYSQAVMLEKEQKYLQDHNL